MTGLRVDFPAIGTTVTVAVAHADDLVPARRATEEVVDEFDRACSRFRPDSEVWALQRAGGRPVAVGITLWAALDAAERAVHVTEGLVDPTVGNALVALGYDRDFAALGHRPIAGPAGAPSPAPGWRCVRRDPERRTVTVPPGLLLDLGSTAKALLVDTAVARARARCAGGVLVGVGGDLAVGGPVPNGGWPVKVATSHLAPPEDPGDTVAVHDGGLATSSTTVRRWRAASGSDPLCARVRHHLVDPRTGLPVEETWTTVSVAGSSCLDANIASTAAVLMGAAAPAWLASLRLPARLLASDGAVVRLGGWPEERVAA